MRKIYQYKIINWTILFIIFNLIIILFKPLKHQWKYLFNYSTMVLLIYLGIICLINYFVQKKLNKNLFIFNKLKYYQDKIINNFISFIILNIIIFITLLERIFEFIFILPINYSTKILELINFLILSNINLLMLISLIEIYLAIKFIDRQPNIQIKTNNKSIEHYYQNL